MTTKMRLEDCKKPRETHKSTNRSTRCQHAQLSIKFCQMELVLRLSTLAIHHREEIPNDLDHLNRGSRKQKGCKQNFRIMKKRVWETTHLRNGLMIRIILWCIFEHNLEQKRVSSQSCRRLCQISIKLQSTGDGQAFRSLKKGGW